MFKKPNNAINTEHFRLYNPKPIYRQQGIFSLRDERLVRYGAFLNGLPIITMELKPADQSNYNHAIHQYRNHRKPNWMTVCV